MVFKSVGYSSSSSSYEPRPVCTPSPRAKGDIVATVTSKSITKLENIYAINNEILGYNLDGNKVLIKVPQNDASFEQYISLPFTKGVTQRQTGRTLLILGSNLHHIEAMQNQFDGVLWTTKDAKELKKYGDTIRWINVGDTKNGFIGLDYNPSAHTDAGVATSLSEVKFLATTLLQAGYDQQKRLFLLKPPYIQEREEGKQARKQGLETLLDWTKAKV